MNSKESNDNQSKESVNIDELISKIKELLKVSNDIGSLGALEYIVKSLMNAFYREIELAGKQKTFTGLLSEIKNKIPKNEGFKRKGSENLELKNEEFEKKEPETSSDTTKEFCGIMDRLDKTKEVFDSLPNSNPTIPLDNKNGYKPK